MRLVRRHALVLTLVALAVEPAAAQEGAAPSAFTVDDAIDLTQLRQPRISPDGSKVLYIRAELDWEENERPGRIRMISWDGTGDRPYTSEEGDASPSWSPDGRWVAFLRRVGDEDEQRQIFLIPTDGGESRQLTRHPTSVRDYEWTADSRAIFFMANDSLDTDVRKERKAGDDAIFVNEGPNGQSREEWSSIWRIDATPDGEPEARRVTAGPKRIGEFAVHPDGKIVAYTFRLESRRNAGFLSEIALVDVASGESERLTNNEAPEGDLAWSPDGSRLLFIAPDLQDWLLDQGNLYTVDLATREATPVATDFPGAIRGRPVWDSEGKSILVAATTRVDAHLYRIVVSSGKAEALTSGPGVVSSPSWSRDRKRVAFLEADPVTPGALLVADVDGAGGIEGRELVGRDEWLSGRRLAEPRVVRWASTDGLEIEGLLYPATGRPSGSPGPMVLEIHGGPAGVFTRGFDADAQVLSALGYAVLQPNVRGSSGYGDALLRGNLQDIGGGDYQDLMAGVEWAIREGVAHPDSLAVKGWSYGGILGGWTITRTDRFKAASLGAMVADWRSEFGAGFNYDVVRWYLGGDPWTNREFWLERSAYTHLDRVSTPTILFHGERDRTDTMEQSMNFFVGLRHREVPSRFILFPREGHGITEPRHHRTRLVEELRWFQRYVRGLPDWIPPERPKADDRKRPGSVTP